MVGTNACGHGHSEDLLEGGHQDDTFLVVQMLKLESGDEGADGGSLGQDGACQNDGTVAVV